MKNYKLFCSLFIGLILLVGIGVLLFIHYRFPSLTSSPQGEVIEQRSFATSSQSFSVEVTYPHIVSGYVDSVALMPANSTIEKYFLDPAHEFIDDNYLELVDFLHDNPAWPGSYQFSIDYKGVKTYKKYLTILLDRYQDTGGAHGLGYHDTLILDTKTGKQISFEDIFPNATSTAQKLPALAHDGLIAQKMQRMEITKDEAEQNLVTQGDYGFKGTIDNFRVFSLSNEGVEFLFAPYQVGAYAEGSYAVLVPWDKLAGETTVGS
jgi:hypothetical protein